MEGVLKDYRTSALSEDQKALLALVEKETRQPASIRSSDVEAVRSAGWSDEAIYDAITVSALFNYYNRWVDASGVEELSPQACRLSVRHLIDQGYA